MAVQEKGLLDSVTLLITRYAVSIMNKGARIIPAILDFCFVKSLK